MHPRMVEVCKDDPSDPDRPTLNNPEVQRLAAEISPNSQATDLGGVMSLNAKLDPEGLVLRVHQPWVSRPRLISLQEVRCRLAGRGLLVPVPLRWKGSTLFRCSKRWAEFEEYIPNERPEPTPDSYLWMYRAMGTLHRELAALGLSVTRPLYATYGPPGTLQRWLPVTEAAVQHDPEASYIARLLRDLVRRLRSQWVPANRLPMQLVHGDVRLGNVCRTPDGETLYLDFGFMARRPRIHDLAYSLSWIIFRPDSQGTAEEFAWEKVTRLVEEYEAAANTTLTDTERNALAPYTAAVPLFQAAIAGFSEDPVGLLRDETLLPFLRIGEWLLAYPEAMLG